MKILTLEIQNYKKIETLFLEPQGKDLKIAGGTGQGKTTAISALWEILGKVGEPIKDGNGEPAQIKIVLGEPGAPSVTAIRRYTEKTSNLSIISGSGEKVSAKDFGDWFSSLAVNPHKIMEMKPLEQVETLLQVADLQGFDLKKTDQKILSLTDTRLNIHRDIEKMKGKIGAEPEEIENVSMDILLEEMRKVESADRVLQNYKSSLQNNHEKIKKHKEELEALEANSDHLCDEIDKMVMEAKDYPPLEVLRQKIKDSSSINEKAATRKKWLADKAESEKLSVEKEHIDNEIKTLREIKKTSLESAKWPVFGLTIDDGEIKYHEIPLSQCGRSEQMLITGAISAKSIRDKKLRVVRLDGIESMSKADFETLSKIFHENGIQVLSTRVSRGEIEEGEIEIVEGGLSEK